MHDTLAIAAPPATRRPSLGLIYLMEGMTSLGSNLLLLGIFFFTSNYYDWKAVHNLSLTSAQGAAYVVGAMLAGRFSRWLGMRWALTALWLAMAVASLIAAVALPFPVIVTAMLIIWSGLSAVVWPQLESIASSSRDPHQMSRQIGTYNLVWAGVAAVTVLCCGMLIKFWPMGVFVVSAAATAVPAVLMLIFSPVPEEAETDPHAPAPAADPRLLQQRTLALWLSRICMPALYVAVYSIAAIMPSLPTIKALDPVGQTVVGSLWMSGRVVVFVLLGATVWWHGRPRVMLIAASFILLCCLAIPFTPSHAVATNVTWLVFWQIAMGANQGMIYTASLYFGMVLSEASTDHGGYHEALIGVGQVVGPGAAAIAAALCPGSLWAGMTPVAIIMGASVGAACVASIRLRRRNS